MATKKILTDLSVDGRVGIGIVPSTSEFMDNLDKKLIDSAFTEDTKPLLRPGYEYDPEVARNTIKEELICKLDEEMQ